MDVKLKVNPKANSINGLSYIYEPCIVESAGGQRLAIVIQSQLTTHKKRGEVTLLHIHLENGRVLDYDLDDGTTLSFDDEKGIGEFTTRGERYRIRALQDFDNYAPQAVESKEDEKD